MRPRMPRPSTSDGGRARLVVGFDLDMTLVDSRPGIAATFHQLVALTGVVIDVDLVVARLGPPLEQELAHWYPLDEVPAAAARYRAMYPDHAITPSPALPGAAEAFAAVRAAGGRILVVTAKKAELAELHLRHLDLVPDEVHGLAWADGKADALRVAGAVVYVGDHVADMAAARAADVCAVGVTTGPCSADELVGAGADFVLDDLRGLPPMVRGAARRRRWARANNRPDSTWLWSFR
jgi:phosphoglycolate phosphatase